MTENSSTDASPIGHRKMVAMLIAAVCLASATLVTAISDAHAHSGDSDARCSAERAMRAVPKRPRAVLRFKIVGENDETQFKLYRLDRNGRRQFVKHVFAGDQERFVTRKSTPWVVTAPEPGGGELCIGIYVPSSRERTIVLD